MRKNLFTILPILNKKQHLIISTKIYSAFFHFHILSSAKITNSIQHIPVLGGKYKLPSSNDVFPYFVISEEINICTAQYKCPFIILPIFNKKPSLQHKYFLIFDQSNIQLLVQKSIRHFFISIFSHLQIVPIPFSIYPPEAESTNFPVQMIYFLYFVISDQGNLCTAQYKCPFII